MVGPREFRRSGYWPSLLGWVHRYSLRLRIHQSRDLDLVVSRSCAIHGGAELASCESLLNQGRDIQEMTPIVHASQTAHRLDSS